MVYQQLAYMLYPTFFRFFPFHQFDLAVDLKFMNSTLMQASQLFQISCCTMYMKFSCIVNDVLIMMVEKNSQRNVYLVM